MMQARRLVTLMGLGVLVVPAAARAQVEVQRLSGGEKQDENRSKTLQAGEDKAAPPIFGVEPEATEGEPGSEEAAAGVPEMHKVQKGDTLWGLCEHYFQDPWKWPQLWAENPLITNPHWIFPGDVIRLQTPSALPLAAAPTAKTEGGMVRTGGGTSLTAQGQALREIGFVDPRQLAAAGEISGSREEKIMLAAGDSVYVSFPADQPLRAGERYTIYMADTDHPVIVPETGESLGYMVRIYGDVTVDQVTEGHVARGQLVETTESVERHFRVGPLFRQFRTIEPKTAVVSTEAEVVANISPNALIAQHMFVVLNHGRTSGFEVGNRLFIIRRGDGYARFLEGWEAKDPSYPKEVVGELMLVDVRDGVSVAWLVRATKEIRIGDVAEMRRGY